MIDETDEANGEEDGGDGDTSLNVAGGDRRRRLCGDGNLFDRRLYPCS